MSTLNTPGNRENVSHHQHVKRLFEVADVHAQNASLLTPAAATSTSNSKANCLGRMCRSRHSYTETFCLNTATLWWWVFIECC